MFKPLLISVLIVLVFLGVCFAARVKEPSACGIFYPDNAKQLAEMVVDLINEAPLPEAENKATVFILPHAGYGYSGSVAAFGYKLLKNTRFRTVVIIGPSHHSAFNGISVYPHGVFSTPLGNIEVDKAFADRLINKEKNVYFYRPAFQKEHSIEVQLPFLQRSLKDFRIVPVVIGDCTLEECVSFASLLKNAIGERRDVLVIISTDLYHGYDYEEAERIDELTISYIKNLDAKGLYYGLRDGSLQACGGLGLVSALFLSKAAGYDQVRLLKYANSAQITGKLTKGAWTVGYAALSIAQEGQTEGAMLSKKQRERLLEIARDAISNYIGSGKRAAVHEDDPALSKELGAFVTLRKNGELRGCIGNLTGSKPLYITIRDMAIESATADPRFSPVSREEIKDIDIEISVLSPLKKEEDPGNIKMGVDGVIVRKGLRSGVFLPQVAIETGWSREEFMSNLCAHKAGLPADAWKDKDTQIFTFTAEVFSKE